MSIRQTTGRICVLALLLLLAAPVLAEQGWGGRLPLPVDCNFCHEIDEPTPSSHVLNVFGLDFQDPSIGNNAWTSYLAGLDSDDDGCTNGAEVGDVDGNGDADNGVTEVSSNPGLAGDCSAASVMDEVTWGQLKEIFDTR